MKFTPDRAVTFSNRILLGRSAVTQSAMVTVSAASAARETMNRNIAEWEFNTPHPLANSPVAG
jgi:hypothetical protein